MRHVDHSPVRFVDLVEAAGVVETVDLIATNQGRFGFCAFHGGNLERRTEIVAAEAAARSGASCYTLTQPAGLRRHIPSAEIGADPSPGLAAFLDHCEVVVALHGYGRRRYFTSLLCGGRNRPLAHHLATAVRAALPYYDTIDELQQIPAGLRGQHATNPCNLPSGGGVQLELPPRVRGLSPLARHWPTSTWPTPPQHVPLFPHLNQLIEGLAEAARTWRLG